jgi:hypothetical protein
MKCRMDQNPVSVETIAATIARSPIVVLPPVTLLPAGFEEVDLAILNWLAGEARRMRRSFALMHYVRHDSWSNQPRHCEER